MRGNVLKMMKYWDFSLYYDINNFKFDINGKKGDNKRITRSIN